MKVLVLPGDGIGQEVAAAAVKVDYDLLPVMMIPKEALAPGAYPIHSHAPDNICSSQPLIKGDAEAALKEARYVYEGEYATQTVHQAPLEPEVSSAYFEGDGENRELVVVGRSINIHFHLNQLKETLGHEKMRYREAFSGGQFGIKVWIITEAIAGAAALHFNRPVRYCPTMAESMLITTKRHAYPSMKVKLSADADRRLNALFLDFTMDKGAYTVNGPVILGRAIMMMQGSYHIPHIKAFGKNVYTNNSFGGSARGAGPPQTVFATESALDMLAEQIRMDPLEFRRMNSLKPGQSKATGMEVKEWSLSRSATPFSRPTNGQSGRPRHSMPKPGRSSGAWESPPFPSESVAPAIRRSSRSNSNPMTASPSTPPARIQGKETTPCSSRSPPISSGSRWKR